MAIRYTVHTALWSILWPFGIFYGYLLFILFWYICCNKKNLATLRVAWEKWDFLQRGNWRPKGTTKDFYNVFFPLENLETVIFVGDVYVGARLLYIVVSSPPDT
jgi:hypothetical protein